MKRAFAGVSPDSCLTSLLPCLKPSWVTTQWLADLLKSDVYPSIGLRDGHGSTLAVGGAPLRRSRRRLSHSRNDLQNASLPPKTDGGCSVSLEECSAFGDPPRIDSGGGVVNPQVETSASSSVLVVMSRSIQVTTDFGPPHVPSAVRHVDGRRSRACDDLGIPSTSLASSPSHPNLLSPPQCHYPWITLPFRALHIASWASLGPIHWAGRSGAGLCSLHGELAQGVCHAQPDPVRERSATLRADRRLVPTMTRAHSGFSGPVSSTPISRGIFADGSSVMRRSRVLASDSAALLRPTLSTQVSCGDQEPRTLHPGGHMEQRGTGYDARRRMLSGGAGTASPSPRHRHSSQLGATL